jgi:hypothetical protein
MSNYIFCKNYEVDNVKLENAAIAACEFWNEHVEPKSDIEFKLSVVDIFDNDIARAYQLADNRWQIEFNRAFLDIYCDDNHQIIEKCHDKEQLAERHNGENLGEMKIFVTMLHEISHVLGFGGSQWRALFDKQGHININYYGMDNSLLGKTIGHDGDHWHDQSQGHAVNGDRVHFSPATVAVMDFIGHKVKKQLRAGHALDEFFDEYHQHH